MLKNVATKTGTHISHRYSNTLRRASRREATGKNTACLRPTPLRVFVETRSTNVLFSLLKSGTRMVSDDEGGGFMLSGSSSISRFLALTFCMSANVCTVSAWLVEERGRGKERDSRTIPPAPQTL